MKVITAIDVCTDNYYGYWKNRVYYAGVGDIGKVVNSFDYKPNDVVKEGEDKVVKINIKCDNKYNSKKEEKGEFRVDV